GKLREPLLRLTAVWRAFNAQAPAADAYGEIRMIGPGGFQGNLGEAPLESPTVFNFFLPDYQPPGLGGPIAPGFQIANESTAYSGASTYYSFTNGAYLGMTSPPSDRPLIDLSSLTVNAANPAAMVATINANMLYGSMSPAMQSTLTTMIGAFSVSTAAEKAWSAIYITMLSPEYATQR